ncbi:hypothetical protein F5Y13DRAFT_45503 [Hypoxylon sp. FL1857]|nr:hypothetical protein F5Y13DRAFT_45503 [Hypoxylon sp. FL1857]
MLSAYLDPCRWHVKVRAPQTIPSKRCHLCFLSIRLRLAYLTFPGLIRYLIPIPLATASSSFLFILVNKPDVGNAHNDDALTYACGLEVSFYVSLSHIRCSLGFCFKHTRGHELHTVKPRLVDIKLSSYAMSFLPNPSLSLIGSETGRLQTVTTLQMRHLNESHGSLGQFECVLL